MLSELKNAYKLVQYGLSLKKQLGFAALFAGIGIVLEIVTQGRQSTGAFYIVLSGLFIYQLIISADVSTLVQSSPYKKKIQCFYPIISVVPWTYITFTIIVVIHWLFAKAGGERLIREHAMNIFLIGCFLFVTMIYFGVTYKFFVISTVCMVISITIPITVVNILSREGSTFFDSLLNEMQGTSYADQQLKQALGEYYPIWAELKNVGQKTGIQTALPYYLKFNL